MPAARKSPDKASTSNPQPGRDGKVIIKAFVDPGFRKRVKALAVELETTVEALVTDGLEALLRKHGR